MADMVKDTVYAYGGLIMTNLFISEGPIKINQEWLNKFKGAFCFNTDFRNYQFDFSELDKTVIYITDPPYNQKYHYNEYDDDLDQDDYIELLSEIPSPRVIIHYPEETINILPKAFNGEYVEDVITWVYNGNQWKHSRSISFWGVKPDYRFNRQPYKDLKDKRIKKKIKNGLVDCRGYDWFEQPQVKNNSCEKTNHPCQIPVKVFDKIIKMIVKDEPEKYLIIDPFCGSGSCGEASLMNKVDFIGFDINYEYTTISNNRFDKIKNQTTLESFQ